MTVLSAVKNQLDPKNIFAVGNLGLGASSGAH